MPEKLHISYPVIVEGKYDRLRLLSIMEGQVLTTEGFGIFKKKEKLSLFRALAAKSPVILLTDPDGAGKLIRSHIGSAIPPNRLIQLYVPKVKGKEARKAAPSAEGTLGVEGQAPDLLRELLLPFVDDDYAPPTDPITKVDFYECGMTGRENATLRRAAFATHCGLPDDMTPNALLAALNVIFTRTAFLAAAEELFAEKEN